MKQVKKSVYICNGTMFKSRRTGNSKPVSFRPNEVTHSRAKEAKNSMHDLGSDLELILN
jgi:hypothetical protein